MSATAVDIAIFAHNEARGISKFISQLSAQTIFSEPGLDVRVLILANGCTDETAAIARHEIAALPPALSERLAVIDLAEGGKSRTWNTFTHELARPESVYYLYVDADIDLPVTNGFATMVAQMASRRELEVFVSRPLKDTAYYKIDIGLVPWLISQGGGSLDDFRTSIAGSLYILRKETAKAIHMPVGLPVEDGFLRAMILTRLHTEPEDLSRIDGDPDVFHIYESIRDVPGLIQHQTRLVLGGAINAVLFAHISEKAPTFEAARSLLATAAQEPGWLSSVLAQKLPSKSYGYVPLGFLYKRLVYTWQNMSLKRLLMLPLGFFLDLAAYVGATLKLMRRGGAGYW